MKINPVERFSLIRRLKLDKKLSYDLEILLNSLTLEELIALKLESVAKAAGNKLYGIPIWFSLNKIVKESVLLFALASCKTKEETARFLGMEVNRFKSYYRKMNMDRYVKESKLSLDETIDHNNVT
jgi:hypothetical protein